MIARASSGSRFCPSSVESNDVDEQGRNHFAFALWNGLSLDGSAEGKAEDRRLGRIDRVGRRRGGACWPSEAPHSLQNFAVVRLDAPQAGQRRGKAVPQASQNLAASAFALSQLGHRMIYVARRYAIRLNGLPRRSGQERSLV